MSDFLTGIEEKIPKQLLKGRIEAEGNVISCLFKDMLLLDETHFSKKDFITKDGLFYFCLLDNLHKQDFHSLDEVTIISNSPEDVIERYNELGGWDTIQHQIDIINDSNFDTYSDILYRENILINLHKDGFNLLEPILINDKKVTPLNLFRKMKADEVTEWYEARMSMYGDGYSNKVLEEEMIDFDDEFIESCEEGLENGIPFDYAGADINGEDIRCFPYLSNQVMGILESTFTMLGGFSSTGKSTFWIGVIMALLNYDRKVLIISNEERVAKFKAKFMVWLLAKWGKYFSLTKKKLMAGDISPEDRKAIKKAQKYWKDNFYGRVKYISINDADMSTVRKKIRENVLKFGFDTVLYDTFKIQESDMTNARQDLALVRDSRELDKLAKKYNIIMLGSVQLAESLKGRLFLDSSVLSNSKQIKEVLEGLFLMRNVYDEELDPKSKYYCHPFRLKKVDDKWIEEEYQPDPSYVWKMLFVEKARNGANSSDTGTAYLMKFSGDFAIFRETCQCRPRHGEIR